jgi:hypothetical protein
MCHLYGKDGDFSGVLSSTYARGMPLEVVVGQSAGEQRMSYMSIAVSEYYSLDIATLYVKQRCVVVFVFVLQSR